MFAAVLAFLSDVAITVIIAVISALAAVLGTGGVAVAYMQRKRTSAEAGDVSASAMVKTAEAESIAVATLKAAVEEIRKVSQDKDAQIDKAQLKITEVQKTHAVEAEEREVRFQAEMMNIKAELRELREASQAARRAMSVHTQWDWNIYHWAKSQSHDFPEPPNVEW